MARIKFVTEQNLSSGVDLALTKASRDKSENFLLTILMVCFDVH